MKPLLCLAASLFLSLAPHARAQTRPLTIAVYPGVTEALWSSIVAAYTATSGTKAQTFAPALPAASIAQAAGHPNFDVALVAAYSAPGLVDAGLLLPVTPALVPTLRTVPEPYWPRSPGGTLMGIPIYFSLYGIAYNTELAKAADFQSWNNLLDAKWKGQIPLNRPTMLAAYDLTLFAKLGGGDSTNVEPGYRFIEKMAVNAHSVYSSMATFESELARGEVAAAPFYSAEIALQKRKGAPELGFTIPKEGGLMLTYLLVVPKGAAYEAEGLKFIDFVLGPKAQLMLAQQASVWPMNAQATLPPETLKELGGTVAETMQHNYNPDWYIVGSHLAERTHAIETLIQKAK